MIERSSLKGIYLFNQLSDERLDEVAAALERRQFAAGEVLFHKGDAGDELFIVHDGGVAIFEPNPERPGQERPLRVFEPGEVLGDMALIDFQPRSLSARAVGPTQTLVLKGEDFRQLLQDEAMALGVMSGLNDRIRYTTEFLGEVRKWVGLVAEGKYKQTFDSSVGQQDQTLSALAAEFARMATQVQQREDALRQEIDQLKIEIDETKRKRQVSEITETDFFKDIQSRAAELRRRRK